MTSSLTNVVRTASGSDARGASHAALNQNVFKKANSLNNDAAHAQRMKEKGTSEAWRAGSGSKTKAHSQASWAGALTRRTAKAAAKREDEMDMELVLHEFIEVLIRIAFWRANPAFGNYSKKPPTTFTPLPDCLDSLLHEIILPAAKRDDSAHFKEHLANDGPMQAVLVSYEEKLRQWFECHAAHMKGAHAGFKLQYKQWLDLLKQGYGAKHGVLGYSPGHEIGTWEINQDSEITGDERCRTKFHAALSMPQAKFAFINSQSLSQMSVGQQKDTDGAFALAASVPASVHSSNETASALVTWAHATWAHATSNATDWLAHHALSPPFCSDDHAGLQGVCTLHANGRASTAPCGGGSRACPSDARACCASRSATGRPGRPW